MNETYAKGNDVDLWDGKDRRLPFDVITLDPENHCKGQSSRPKQCLGIDLT